MVVVGKKEAEEEKGVKKQEMGTVVEKKLEGMTIVDAVIAIIR
jgi:hypothetical protein